MEKLAETLQKGDEIICLYPSKGEGELVLRYGIVEDVFTWGLKIATPDGGYRSFRFEKIEKLKITHRVGSARPPKGWGVV